VFNDVNSTGNVKRYKHLSILTALIKQIITIPRRDVMALIRQVTLNDIIVFLF